MSERELPREVRNALARLLAARERASADAIRCPKCGYVGTLNVEVCERDLIRAVENVAAIRARA
jgi:uncharacterized OB-fold protein